ncbi:MAG: hypothetical protein IKT98_10640 [Selenomonadaceae bacterium]|nr:hypothetical protein [Selenomonadaceae bacterium]
MATREENIKKINMELEKLTDEELDGVAGGNCYQMADDSRFLNSLNGSCDRYGATKIFLEIVNYKEIRKAWSQVGIEAHIKTYTTGENKYYLNGQEITQEEARQHAMKVTGHYMSESEWNW